jgi:hypothetical protein|tara:strand:- start:2555 stop:4615 length:2061 start_codon:yes stop_codon:yes gene_type:complete
VIFAIITLLSALSIAGVAAWYSIIGLSALFGAAVGPVILMASTLEVGKLVSASWLYRNWHIAPKVLKIYLTIAVLGLMFITSMGIFGFLSRAHLEQAGSATEAQAKVERVDERIIRIEGRILVTKDKITRLQTTDVEHNNTNISRSIDQQIERRDSAWDRVKNSIEQEQLQISALRTQLDKDIKVQQDRLASAKDRVREDTAIKQEAIKRLELQLAQLDADVKAYTDKGVEKRNWGNSIDWIKRGKELRERQKPEREALAFKIREIENEIAEIRKEEVAMAVIVQEEIKTLRNALAASIAPFQSKIDGYRGNAQSEINKANAEIKNLQDRLGTKADDTEIAIKALEVQIDQYFLNVDTLKEERFALSNDVRTLEAEVGPLKYVAELVYGNDLQNNLDKAVRFVILILIFVFDPLAVCMIIAANISLIRVFGNGDDDDKVPAVLKGFVEKQEKDEVIDEFFKEEYEPSVQDDLVKKKDLIVEETISDYGGLDGQTKIVLHDAGNLDITNSQPDEGTILFHNISDVGIAENLEIKEVPVEVEKVIIKEVPVEVIVEKEIIKEVEKIVEKIVEVPVDRIIEIPIGELTEKEAIIGGKIKDVPVNKDKFSSASLRRPDGSTLELKRNPEDENKDKAQGSLSDISDSGILTKRDRIQREISKNTGQKRLDPWTGNKRWQRAKYDENDEDKK